MNMTRQTDLLGGLTEREADDIRALGSPIRIGPGELLFQLGTTADRLFLIERGRLALTLPMHVGDREQEVPVEERTTGQALGWSALIPPHRFTLSAKALVDTEVLALPRVELLAHFDANPRVGLIVTRNVASVIGQRLQVIQTMWLREMQRVIKLTYA
jgi:CRP-like cAMP-binding protein